DRISRNSRLKDWIRVQNNFIGVCAGIKKSITFIEGSALEEIEAAIDRLEGAIGSINGSMDNLGKVRREVVLKYFSSYEDVATLAEFDLLDKVSSWISYYAHSEFSICLHRARQCSRARRYMFSIYSH